MKVGIVPALLLAALNANAQEVTVDASASAEAEVGTDKSILEDLRARADYTFSTRTSNRVGSERDKTTDRHSAGFGFDYDPNNRLVIGLDGSVNFIAREDDTTLTGSDYTSFALEPHFRLRTDPLSLAFRAGYLSKDSELFEVEEKKEPSLGGSLDAILRLGSQLRLRTGLSGRKIVEISQGHSTIYGGLGLAVNDNFSLDGGVAHEIDNFYGQSLDYGVLGAESRGRTSARAEMLVGERFGVGLAVRTPIAKKLDLLFGGSTHTDGGDIRNVNSVKVSVGLAGRM